MRRCLTILTVLSLSLLLVNTSSYAAGFVWEPIQSSYLRPGTNPISGGSYTWTRFNPLNPLAAAAVGLGTGEGYGTVAPDGVGDPFTGTTAYGGAAPASLAPQGINERPGHYYFGFANTYPTVSNFSAYEMGTTTMQPGTELSLKFRRTTDDPINFIGICGGADAGDIYVDEVQIGGDDYLFIKVLMTNPVYSTKGGDDQDSVFGLYINYGNYDEDNVGVDYDGAVFRTNIHWWDIDVPSITRDKLASIQLSTRANTDAIVAATIPDSYFDRIGVDPDDVVGYVDENELPLGQGLESETYSFAKVSVEGQIIAPNGSLEEVSEFIIHSNQWSTHDIGVGVIPEPTTMSLLILSGLSLLIRKRR